MRLSPPAALVALVLVGCTGARVSLVVQAPATLALEPGGYEEARVTRVIDGDTVEVEIAGRVPGAGAGEAQIGAAYDLRLVGIDTPESVRPGTPVECFAKEASAATTALLEGETVRLIKDVEETDSFGRLLRYVYIGDEMANARLVVNGYAHAFAHPPNIRHSELFVQLQQEARESERGLWAPDTCNGQE